MRRLRLGEWLAALAGVGLIVSLTLDWYGVRGRATGISGFAAFDVIDLLLVLVAAMGIALAIVQATRDRPALPVAAAVLTVTVGILGDAARALPDRQRAGAGRASSKCARARTWACSPPPR